MKTLVFPLLTVAVAALFVSPMTAQSGQPPVGSCPEGFTPMMMDMHEDHQHHIGLTDDLNQDGYLCMKVLDSGFHVHVDDVVQ